MSGKTVTPIQNTVRKTEEWLRELSEIGHYSGMPQAYSVLHAVLRSLRDVLPVNEAVQFSSGMPMLMRGMFFEGWNPSKVPLPARNWETFHHRIKEQLHGSNTDPLHACRSVFELLRRRIDPGEFQDMYFVLHHSIREMLSPGRNLAAVS